MASFAKLIGFRTYTDITEDSFIKKYDRIPKEHWVRIRDASVLLSDTGIGPKVISINNKNTSIQYERVIPFDYNTEPMIPGMSIDDIRNTIIALVDSLHSLGYAHGDLHLGNLGYKDNKIYILDHDSIYKIDDLYKGKLKWLTNWMKVGFEWEGSLEDFVNNDYDTWNSDWMES
jgi:hypothetical protein